MGKLTPVPGLHRVYEKKELPLVTRVTGHFLGALTYLVSLAAERSGKESDVLIRFGSDGALKAVWVRRVDQSLTLSPGDVAYLKPEDDKVTWTTDEDYTKAFRPVRLR